MAPPRPELSLGFEDALVDAVEEAVQEATGDIEDPALRAMLKTDPERPALDTARTGPLIGVGPTAQRMIGILLWRT